MRELVERISKRFHSTKSLPLSVQEHLTAWEKLDQMVFENGVYFITAKVRQELQAVGKDVAFDTQELYTEGEPMKLFGLRWDWNGETYKGARLDMVPDGGKVSLTYPTSRELFGSFIPLDHYAIDFYELDCWRDGEQIGRINIQSMSLLDQLRFASSHAHDVSPFRRSPVVRL